MSKMAFTRRGTDFTEHDEIWAVDFDPLSNTDGPVQLTNGPGSSFDPSWSQVRAEITFTHEDAKNYYHVWRMSIGRLDSINPATEIRALTSGPYVDFQPQFSPNGEQIAFVRAAPNRVDPWEPLRRGGSIYVMNRDGSDVRLLVDDYASSFRSPTWSPDGRTIAFGHLGQIGVVDVRFPSTPRYFRPTGYSDEDPDWSAYGIAFMSYNLMSGGELWVMNGDGTNRRRVAAPPPPNTHRLIYGVPSWGPNGEIAFARYSVYSDLDPQDIWRAYLPEPTIMLAPDGTIRPSFPPPPQRYDWFGPTDKWGQPSWQTT